MAFGYAGAWMLGWTTPGGVFVRRVVIFWIAVVRAGYPNSVLLPCRLSGEYHDGDGFF
jgi:hypothetical protein